MKKKESRLDHQLKIKPNDPLHSIIEWDLDLKTNQIYLFGIEAYGPTKDTEEPGVEYVMANRFIRNVNLCMRVNPGMPLLIHMKTCGGEWSEGMAIYDMIRAFPWPVTILSYTHARSMSSLILQAANKRVLMPNSSFMFHDGTVGMEGTIKQLRSIVNQEKIAEETMMNIYIQAMKQQGKMASKPEPTIKKWLRTRMDKEEDVYLTANQAVEYGFADAVFDGNWANLIKYSSQEMARKFANN
jgi:ATP-dependent Clp protease protease subunit